MSFAEDLNNMIDRRMIVFSPHPDDETLACGGTIIRKIREGYDVYTRAGFLLSGLIRKSYAAPFSRSLYVTYWLVLYNKGGVM
jgi:hypothetical protein